MEENKRNFAESEFVKDFVKVYTANHGEEKGKKLATKVVGNNGYQLGQTFTLTGEIDVATSADEKGKVTATYLILKTAEGTDLSLQSLMSVSSLKGYTDEEVTEEWYEKVNNKEVMQSRTCKAEFIDNFEFEQVWTPPTRNLLTLAGMIAEGALDLSGKTVTYLGLAVKPFTATKDGESFGEKWHKDYKRAITTKLWSIE